MKPLLQKKMHIFGDYDICGDLLPYLKTSLLKYIKLNFVKANSKAFFRLKV